VAKSTLAEVDRRVALAASLLCRGLTPAHLRRAFRAGVAPAEVSARQIDRYIDRARATMAAMAERDVSELRHEAATWYWSVIADPLASRSDQLRARAQLDRLLALERGAAVEISGRAGGPVEVSHGLPPEVAAAVVRLAVSLQDRVEAEHAE
jgi:hypothetical protein